MKDESANPGGPVAGATGLPAARRRLPMVEVDPSTPLTGSRRAAHVCSTRSRAADSSSPTTSCGTPAIPRPSSARDARWVTSPGRRALLPAFSRRHLCHLLPGPATRRAPATATSWAGTCRGTQHSASLDALLVGRQIGHVPPRVLPTGRRPRLRNLLDDPPRRRGDGLQLRPHGPHRLRTPGAVGGLAARLATAVLHHAHRRRRARLAASVAVAGRTPHRPVVALEAGRSDDLAVGGDGRQDDAAPAPTATPGREDHIGGSAISPDPWPMSVGARRPRICRGVS